MNDSEILAPAGSLESLLAAINCGADAVYVGGKQFSARQNAANFDNDELKQASDICHLHGVKIYLAVNTIIFDSQVKEFSDFIEYAAECGIDAFIVQDLGAAEIIRNIIPDANIHGSTQMTIHSVRGAEFLQKLGFKRAVLSRELNADQIAEICRVGIETEVFVHGALCMCVSGQCYMSSMIGQRSANRGLCAQPCRLPFSACKNPENTALSLKDLSLMKHLKKMSENGVFSFKIEGRMKRPEYVASAVSACRQALNGQSPDMALLKSVFSRSGFTDGYYTGTLDNMFGKREKEDVIAAKDLLPEIRRKYSKDRKTDVLYFNAEVKNGNPVRLNARSNCGNVSVSGEIPQQAIKKTLDHEYLEKQLSKLGGTIYEYKGLKSEIDAGLSLSAKSINALRREASCLMDKKIIEHNTPVFHKKNLSIYPENSHEELSQIRMRISCGRQLEAVSEADYVIMPSYVFLHNYFSDTSKVIIEPPRFIYNESEITNELEQCRRMGAEHLMCNNPAYIETGKNLGFKLHGDFGLNIANSYSINFLKKIDFEDAVLSFELKLGQINALKKSMNTGIIAYGYLPVMLTRNCPVKNETGCKKCEKFLQDRTGRRNKIICHKKYTEILNSQPLYMADRMDEIKNVSFITLYFNDESPSEIKKIIREYKSGGKMRENITRGLYYRGVL
ncbi:DUF3656 domain-containing U32 family peptidase [Porcipelethomonas sp.]|uniref:U32 family peptidase n=1 Tax=Porcipelethomonas sp. TaxID=2981675 RepID=UPI003EF6F812